MRILVKDFSELNTVELYDILSLRAAVFVVEQQCAYQDLDGKDQKAIHIMGYSGDDLLAYTRVFAPGDYFNEASIGRVVVSGKARGKGYGKEIMEASIGMVERKFKEKSISLSAQTYLVKLYRELGFNEVGEEYLEDGIPHIRMIRN